MIDIAELTNRHRWAILALMAILALTAAYAIKQNGSVARHELLHASSCHDLGGQAVIEQHGLQIAGWGAEASSSCSFPSSASRMEIDTKRLLDSENEQSGYPLFALNDSLLAFTAINAGISILVGWAVLRGIEDKLEESRR